MIKICLDAGVIGLFFSEDSSKQIKQLMNDVLKKKIEAHILKPILIESYLHLCKEKGKEIAKISIISFLHKYPVKQINIDENIIILAGELKCQNRKKLSYNDCISIAYCLNEKIFFHTTEKLLKSIPNNTLDRLKIKTYIF